MNISFDLDKHSSEQLYLQLRRNILEAIHAEDLTAGQQMPSIADLCRQTGISRMTVRRAIDQLVQEKWLFTVPGKGTFVSHKLRIEQSMQHLKGWTDEIRASGFDPSTRLISVRVVPASAHIATSLSLTPGDPLFEILRVRCADQVALAAETAYLPVKRFPDLDQYIKEEGSLYRLLRDHFQTVLIRAFQSIEAGPADKHTAELLALPVGEPVLITERVSYDSLNRPVEYVYAKHRPGLIRFVAELNVDTSAAQTAGREISSALRNFAG
jgi:GntR family transcriptional regulator